MGINFLLSLSLDKDGRHHLLLPPFLTFLLLPLFFSFSFISANAFFDLPLCLTPDDECYLHALTLLCSGELLPQFLCRMT